MLSSGLPETEDLNLTPLIDVVFNLLIFFLLGTTYAREEREIELTLPEVGQVAPVTDAPDDLTVNVQADESIVVQGKRMSANELEVFLQDARLRFPDQAVTIRGDANARYESVVTAIDACKRAGIVHLDVAVREREGTP